MSTQASAWAASTRTNLGPGGKLLLLVLADFADEKHSCDLSDERLAEMTEMTPREARHLLVRLDHGGLVTIEDDGLVTLHVSA